MRQVASSEWNVIILIIQHSLLFLLHLFDAYLSNEVGLSGWWLLGKKKVSKPLLLEDGETIREVNKCRESRSGGPLGAQEQQAHFRKGSIHKIEWLPTEMTTFNYHLQH